MKKLSSTLIIISIILLQNCSVNDPANNSSITALTKIDEIEAIVKEHAEGLVLKSIISKDVDENGKSEKWIYKYSSAGISKDYYFHTTENRVNFDSTSILILDRENLIVGQYFDSDEALKIAENSGGKEFRENNINYTIEITLIEPMVQNSDVMWFVKYKSIKNNNILHIGINNTTKEVALYY